jgi:hypothetical protein
VLTTRGAGLSADVGELEGLDGSTTMPVLDGVEGSATMPVLDRVEGSTTVLVLDRVEGSTTVPVLDGVEGMTYRTGKSTTKSTMRHKSTMVLPNPSMCELDLRYLQIDLRYFTLITHLPQPGFQSSYRHQKRIHRNRGW